MFISYFLYLCLFKHTNRRKMNRYRKGRIVAATLVLAAVTLLFLDFSGTAHHLLGWLAEVQLLPALLALNVGVVAALLLATLLFGRLYCSVICPLGILQDGFARLGRRAKKNRYGYSRPKTMLRVVMLLLFAALLIGGVGSLFTLLAPYSAFGRIASNLLQPLWIWGNNLLAAVAAHFDSYAFYTVEVWWKGVVSLLTALATLVVVGWLAWRNGRTWCNTICPVGTLLGFVSRCSLLRPVIDTEKCNGCMRCARNCKAACIDPKAHTVDMSRCVVCFDCLDNCKQGAISYRLRGGKPTAAAEPSAEKAGMSRRAFLSVAAAAIGSTVVAQEKKKVDGGVATILDKKIPDRKTPILPAGALSARHLAQHCTACQLCVAACPNGVLRPSQGVMTLLQPELSYERGYCRPECTRCAEVCPTNAIEPITREEKTSIRIGHAVWVRENCLAASEGVRCDNCARHCPTGAILMVENPAGGVQIPAIDTARCIGCGACEFLCPARPFSAIYVEGHDTHQTF